MDFFEKINEISPIAPDQWGLIEASLKIVKIKRSDALLRASERALHIGFITKGAFRLFYLTHDGREFNQSFKFEGELVAGYASLLTMEPCNFSIEALEDSEVILLPFEKLTSLYQSSSQWERLGRKVAEQHFLNKEAREASFLLMDAKSRYLKLLKDRPGIDKRVPQYHIASYLGITASAFNRLVKDL